VDYGVLQTAPLIRECPVNLECKILHVLDLGSHRLIVGEIVESHVRSDCMVDGQPDSAKIDPIVYLTGNQQYCRLGEMVGRAFSIGKKD
jgi:flavin reductase (DIM6/NTAB) family NADH-FMN oxidoreductase RutF